MCITIIIIYTQTTQLQHVINGSYNSTFFILSTKWHA